MGEENNILEENVQAVEEVLDTIPKADTSMDITTSGSNGTSNEIWWVVAGAAVTGILVAGGRWVYNKLKRKKNKPEDIITVVKNEPEDEIVD